MSTNGEPDLTQLFPNLAPIIANWDATRTSTDPLRTNPEHAGLTDEQIQSWMAGRPGIQVPLPRLIQGQQPGQPQFAAGHSGPAPVGGWEDGPNGPQQTQQVPGGLPPQDTGGMGQQPPPTADLNLPGALPGTPIAPTEQQPIPDTELPDVIVVGEHQLPRDRLAGLAAMDEILRTDETLRRLVAGYMTTGQVPVQYVPQPGGVGTPSPGAPIEGTGGGVPSPHAAPVPSPTLPPADLDMDDPAVAALWNTMQATLTQQNELISRLAQGQQQVAQNFAEREQNELAAIARASSAKFGEDKELDENQLNEVRQVASSLGIVQSFMDGIDPITQLPVRPDPHMAVYRAMEVAYNSLPAYRDREFEMMQRQRVEDQQRQRKLSALGGASAPTPRQPAPIPNDPQGKMVAMHNEVAQMLSGNWNDPRANQ